MRNITKISLLATAALIAAPAMAQTAPVTPNEAPQAASAAPNDPAGTPDIIVTGSARSEGVRRLDAGYSITTATLAQIQRVTPSSTADLLKIVPGVFVEPTGGVSGANIGVRGFPQSGDAPFVTVQLNSAPIFPPPTLSFLENSTLFRIDDTIERVEVLRGGPSPVFSNGQPGLTLNFIQKKGGDTPEGSFRLTTGRGDLYRADAFYGTKLAEGWYGTVGGFYRVNGGIRDTQFPADKGGQVVANVTHRWGDSDFTIYGRYTRDKNAFYTGAPVLSSNNGKSISPYPTLDQRDETLIGRDTRYADLEISQGATPGRVSRDFGDGRNIDLGIIGGEANIDLGGNWRLSDRAGYTRGSADTLALFTSAVPQTLGSYITDRVAAANAAAVRAARGGVLATAGSASYVNGGAAITDLNTPVIVAGLWSAEKKIRSFTNELRLEGDISNHHLTFGTYFADYSNRDRWYNGNNVLLQVEPNARLINVAVNNGALVSRSGFVSATTNQIITHWEGNNYAGFLADEWKITDALKFDAGVRLEHYFAKGDVGNTSVVDLDGNAATVYNNGATVFNGTFRHVEFKKTKVAYTAGLNYVIDNQASLFARLNSGFRFPQFDDLRGGSFVTQKVKQYEVGGKIAMPGVQLNGTLFYNKFDGQSYQQIVVAANGNQTTVTGLAGSRSYGVELDGNVRLFEGFTVAANGTWFNGKFRNFAQTSDPLLQNGNKVQRQPSFQARVTPTYRLPVDFAKIDLFGTYTHIGKRFSDMQNQQLLLAYDTFDAGISAEFGRFTMQLTGTNLTNKLGLTEGNARIIGTTQGTVIARSIFGRAWQLSGLYKF